MRTTHVLCELPVLHPSHANRDKESVTASTRTRGHNEHNHANGPAGGQAAHRFQPLDLLLLVEHGELRVVLALLLHRHRHVLLHAGSEMRPTRHEDEANQLGKAATSSPHLEGRQFVLGNHHGWRDACRC